MTEGDSLSTQLELGKGVCERLKKDKIVSSYKDWNEGAKSSAKDDFSNRPILNRLLLEIDSGKIKHLFVYDTDRLSRNENTWFIIRQRIKENKVKLYTRTGELDLNDPTDNFLTGILGFVNQYTNEQRKIRSIIGRENKIKQGYFTGGLPNFGYATVDKKYAINKEEAKWVKKMFTIIEKGGSVKDIKTLFDTNGVEPRRTKTWNTHTLETMLENKIYIGKHKWKGIEVNTPIIIKQSQFDRVQKIRNSNRKTYWNNNNSKEFYLLSSLLECGSCKSRLWGRRHKPTGSSLYICPNKHNNWRSSQKKKCNSTKNINIERTDELVWNTAIETVGSSHFMKEKFKQEILEQKKGTTGSVDEDIKKLDRLIQQLRRKEKSTLENISKVEVDRLQERMLPETYQLVKDRLVQEIDEIRADIEQAEDSVSIKNNEKGWVDWVSKYGLKIEKQKSFSEQDKQAYLQEVIDKVVVSQTKNKEGHTLDIRFSQPIVKDRIKYKDESNKRKGYEVLKGKKKQEVFLEHKKGRPKKKVNKETYLSNSFNSISMNPTGRFIDHHDDTSPITSANLNFSVKITTNKLWTTTYSDYQLFLYKRIIALQEEGLGYRKIAQVLNKEGLKTPRGKQFRNNHVHSILKKKKIRDTRINKEFDKEVSALELQYKE